MKHKVLLSNGQVLTIIEREERIEVRWGDYAQGWLATLQASGVLATKMCCGQPFHSLVADLADEPDVAAGIAIPPRIYCDCGWSGSEVETVDPQDLMERLGPNPEVLLPVGECPKCGLLVYDPDEEKEYKERHRKVVAFDRILECVRSICDVVPKRVLVPQPYVPPHYRHRYPVLCPECSKWLWEPKAMRMGVSVQGHEFEVSTEVDADGWLHDVSGLMANGLHCYARCFGCGTDLDELLEPDTEEDVE